jgi:hypothetical protein
MSQRFWIESLIGMDSHGEVNLDASPGLPTYPLTISYPSGTPYKTAYMPAIVAFQRY